MLCYECGSNKDSLALGSICSTPCLKNYIEAIVGRDALADNVRSAIVTGGRAYRGYHSDRLWMRKVLLDLQVSQLVHGDCWGADKWSAQVASNMGLNTKAVPADWDAHGKSAGPKRNKLVIETTDNIQALLILPGDNGTQNMIRTAMVARNEGVRFPLLFWDGRVL